MLKLYVIVYETPDLTNNISTFCPYRIFICFVWISDQTTIISLYSINWLVFITEMQCVDRAVRIKSLNIIQVILSVWKIKASSERHNTSI